MPQKEISEDEQTEIVQAAQIAGFSADEADFWTDVQAAVDAVEAAPAIDIEPRAGH